eukprot:3942985-Prymnesium_polylepis.2
MVAVAEEHLEEVPVAVARCVRLSSVGGTRTVRAGRGAHLGISFILPRRMAIPGYGLFGVVACVQTHASGRNGQCARSPPVHSE